MREFAGAKWSRAARNTAGRAVLRVLGLLAALSLAGAAVLLATNRPQPIDSGLYLRVGERYDVTIYRDDYGVPHIYGRRDPDTAFGLAYAHAEDDFATIQEVLLATRGNLAALRGPAAATTDYLVAFMGVWDAVNAGYETQLSAHTRAIARAYADGLNVYAAQHPGEVLPTALPVTGRDIVAGFSFKSPLFYGFDEIIGELFAGEGERALSLHGEQPLVFSARAQPAIGSQGVAIAPQRSADGRTRLLINSHQPLTGPVAWYEARLHSLEGWDIAGGTFPGSPLILHGHNRHLGWANTVNKPDLVDVYRLQMDPRDDNRYLLDGRWHTLEQREIDIEVKLLGPLHWTVTETLYHSRHGPVLKLPHGTFALRWAGMGETRTLEQLLAVNKATTMAGFEDALAMLAQPSINYVYADAQGNIAHYYNASFPLRREGWEWDKDLPGDRSELIWSQYLPFSAIPATRNPPGGVVFNANNTPFVATVGAGGPERGDFSPTLGIETEMTNRAHRLRRLLAADGSIGREAFRRIKYDLYYDEALPGIVELRELLAAGPPPGREDLAPAYELLASWNLGTGRDNRAAALASLTLRSRLDFRSRDPSVDLVEAMSGAVTYLRAHFGRIDPPWGEVYRHRRGDGEWPIDGGPDILRAVYGEVDEDTGRYYNVAGDSYIMFVEWDERGQPHSTSVHSFGSATGDADSAHYADQVELFLQMREKPVYFERDELLRHVERAYSPLAPGEIPRGG